MLREDWLKIRRKVRARDVAKLLHVSKKLTFVRLPGGVIKQVVAKEGSTFSASRNKGKRLARAVPYFLKRTFEGRRERQRAGVL